MDSSFVLKIMTPIEVIFEGEVDMVVAVGEDGDFGVLPGHTAMMASLKEGPVRLYKGNHIEKRFQVSSGWSLIQGNKATFLVNSAVSF